jgi:hypothetical protein
MVGFFFKETAAVAAIIIIDLLFGKYGFGSTP